MFLSSRSGQVMLESKTYEWNGINVCLKKMFGLGDSFSLNVPEKAKEKRKKKYVIVVLCGFKVQFVFLFERQMGLLNSFCKAWVVYVVVYLGFCLCNTYFSLGPSLSRYCSCIIRKLLSKM